MEVVDVKRYGRAGDGDGDGDFKARVDKGKTKANASRSRPALTSPSQTTHQTTALGPIWNIISSTRPRDRTSFAPQQGRLS